MKRPAPRNAIETPSLLSEIALQNAVARCARETYGALVAHYQARAAIDPEVRAAMSAIAQDETRHAALSWRVARRRQKPLPGGAGRSVVHTRSAALAQLLDEMESGQSPSDAIGWPAPANARHMIERLGSALGIA